MKSDLQKGGADRGEQQPAPIGEQAGMVRSTQGQAPVSAVVPCYQCASTLRRAFESIVGQTLRPAEIILVDDGSSDGTADVLESLAGAWPGYVKVVQLPGNAGPAAARNAGWAAATQPYVAFLDADDAWHPRKIEVQYGWMDAHPEYGLVGHAHGQSLVFRPDLASEPELSCPVRPVTRAQALLSNPFATPSVMLRRDVPFRFKDDKRYIEDYLLWSQIILSGIPAAYIDRPLVSTYKADYGDSGLSAHLWKMEEGELDAYWQIYRQGKLGLPLVALLFVYSLAKYLRRVLLVSLASRR